MSKCVSIVLLGWEGYSEYEEIIFICTDKNTGWKSLDVHEFSTVFRLEYPGMYWHISFQILHF